MLQVQNRWLSSDGALSSRQELSTDDVFHNGALAGALEQVVNV